MNWLVMHFGIAKVLPDRVQESFRLWGRRNSAMEDLFERMSPSTVKHIGVFAVLAYGDAVQIDACKDSPAARPGEQFSSHADVGAGLRIASYGTRGGGCIRADLEFIAEKILQAPVVRRDEHQVGTLTADLEAKRTAGKADEDRSAPSVMRAAGDHALAVFGAYDERAFDDPGHHGNACGAASNSVGDGLVGDGHDGVDHISRGIKPVIESGLIVSSASSHTKCGDKQKRKDSLHEIPPESLICFAIFGEEGPIVTIASMQD
jgi:hypothetical protein